MSIRNVSSVSAFNYTNQNLAALQLKEGFNWLGLKKSDPIPDKTALTEILKQKELIDLLVKRNTEFLLKYGSKEERVYERVVKYKGDYYYAHVIKKKLDIKSDDVNAEVGDWYIFKLDWNSKKNKYDLEEVSKKKYGKTEFINAAVFSNDVVAQHTRFFSLK